MTDALYNGNIPFAGGYDPGNRYQGADAAASARENEAVREQVAAESASTSGTPFGFLTIGPHTAGLFKGIVGDLAFGGWDDFNQWLIDNENIFTGEAGSEMRSIFIHAFNTGNAMRLDDEERNGKTTFTLVS